MTMYVVRNPFDESSRFPFDYPSVFDMDMPVHRFSPYSRSCTYRSRPIQSYCAPVTRRVQVAAPSYPWEVAMPHLHYGGSTADLLDWLSDHSEEEAKIQKGQKKFLKKKRQQERRQEQKERRKVSRNNVAHKEAAVSTSVKSRSDFNLSTDGTAFELRMPIAPHATISNVAMNVLRNTHDADRKLQVTVDTETREQVALFESWPMVSVSKHSASRTVSLPAEAKVEGVAVVLIEAKTSNESSQGEAQERELLIKIPREVATYSTATVPANATTDAFVFATSSGLESNSQAQNKAVGVEEERQVRSNEEKGDDEIMAVDESSHGSSDVSVEDVESDDEDYDAAR